MNKVLGAIVLLATIALVIMTTPAPSHALVLDPRPTAPNYCMAPDGMCTVIVKCNMHKKRHHKPKCRPVHGWR